MKKLLTLLFCLFTGLAAFSQVYQVNPTWFEFGRIKIKKSLMFPTGCGIPTIGTLLRDNNERMAALYYDSCGHRLFIFDPTDSTFNEAGGGADTASLSSRINLKADSSDRRSDSVFYYHNGLEVFAYKDSVGVNSNLGDGIQILVPNSGLKTLELPFSSAWLWIDNTTYSDKIRLGVDPQVGYGLQLAPITDVINVDTTSPNHLVTTSQLRDTSKAVRALFPAIRNYYTVPARGISASANVTNYSPGKVDSIFYKFSTTAYGSGSSQDYGGWLTSNLSGDSLKVTAPFWVAIGNSIIEGHPAQHGRLHPSIDLTKQDVPGQITYYLQQLTGMRFFNHGIGGQTSSQVWARWDRDVLGATVSGVTTLTAKPQGVIIECGINDLYAGLTVDTIKKNFTRMAASCAREGIYCVLLTVPGDEVNSYTQNRQVDDINAWLRSGALNKYNVVIVDFNSWWKDVVYDDNMHGNSLLVDDIHPTEVGYDSLANFIFRQAMLPRLEKIIFRNELSPGFTGYSRPASITFNNTAYSITSALDSVVLTAPLKSDTVWVKINSSTNITGTSYTGFSHIEYIMSYPIGNNSLTIGRKASSQKLYPYFVLSGGKLGVQTEQPSTPFEVNTGISRSEPVAVGPELRTYLNLAGGQGPSSHSGKGGFYIIIPDGINETFINMEIDVTDAAKGASKIIIGFGNSAANVTYLGYMSHFPPTIVCKGVTGNPAYIIIGDSTYNWDYTVMKINRVNLYAGFSLAKYASYDTVKVRFTTTPINLAASITPANTYTINSLNTFSIGTPGVGGVTGIPVASSVTSESLMSLDTVTKQWKRVKLSAMTRLPLNSATTYDSLLVYNDGVIERVPTLTITGEYSVSVTTTDATPTTAYTIPLPLASHYRTEVICNSMLTDGNGGYGAKKARTYLKNASGTISHGSLTVLEADEYLGTGLSTATFTIKISSNNIIVEVTGEASKTITHNFKIKVTSTTINL